LYLLSVLVSRSSIEGLVTPSAAMLGADTARASQGRWKISRSTAQD
jgi:hypothetical protein